MKCNKGRCEQTCSNDGECGEGNICEASRCVKAQCKSDDACGTGATCEQGRCKRTEASNTGGDTGGPTEDDLKCDMKARVQFDFNAADLRPDGRAALDNMAKCMKKNAPWRLTVEGHADERGTPEFNLSLGESRAKSIKKYLTALGVEDGRVKVISYGEEKPVNPASSEEAWAANRRGELIVNP
jgi:peptidoglycan-associated lipoprotein